jgi:hypothetical protein
MLALSCHLQLANTYRFFHFGFPTAILCVFLVCPMRTGLLDQTLQSVVITLIAFYEVRELYEAIFV